MSNHALRVVIIFAGCASAPPTGSVTPKEMSAAAHEAFFHREDILRVEPLREQTTVGARIVFRPIEGMTPEFLQRLVDCHLARNATLGDESLGLEDDPLGLPDSRAQVLRVWDGLAVEVQSDRPEIALRILARANALAP